ncbi:MAG TPA: regulatory iron-sulfur-containing complex subunit RicT [Prolixibacteraceae bacterium]|nr:regulatory iron-sulfur-containing complex subunit RicT [Prolixibacteraceae bacterium]
MDDLDLVDRGCCNGHGGTCSKLHVYDWLGDVINIANPVDLVEVRFKNTRKDYFKNSNNLKLDQGDIVAVESSPGHDIGIVTLTGDLVLQQMKKHKATLINGELRKIYRKAKPADIDKWKEAISLEHQTMLRSRQIANDLRLDMKIGDVEYQGDRTKAIFYYLADDRVDFRQLIKVLADTFKIRVEMKQIGARQEAGRIGGIGPCGREICCASWIHSFVSVTTNSARYQDLALNPQKLAGQCGKLKCCLNYEVDAYIDAQKDFPSTHMPLEIENGTYQYQKADILKRVYYYSKVGDHDGNLIPVAVERVKEILQTNQRGRKVSLLGEEREKAPAVEKINFEAGSARDTITRFDDPSHPKNKNRGGKSRRRNKKPRTGNEEK